MKKKKTLIFHIHYKKKRRRVVFFMFDTNQAFSNYWSSMFPLQCIQISKFPKPIHVLKTATILVFPSNFICKWHCSNQTWEPLCYSLFKSIGPVLPSLHIQRAASKWMGVDHRQWEIMILQSSGTHTLCII